MSSLMTTNDAKCVQEIKSRIAFANAVFNKKKDSFPQQSVRKCNAVTAAMWAG